MEETKVIYVTVAIRCQTDCDTREVMEDLDYHFEHPSIIDTEIIDFSQGIQGVVDELRALRGTTS